VPLAKGTEQTGVLSDDASTVTAVPGSPDLLSTRDLPVQLLAAPKRSAGVRFLVRYNHASLYMCVRAATVLVFYIMNNLISHGRYIV
jgi:hypothetical protein